MAQASGRSVWSMSPGIVAESDLSGNLQSEYIFFDGDRIARKDFSGSTTSVSYYFSDHLKTASVITDSLGNIKEDEDFYPWGGELQFVNNDPNHYKFTGKARDNETGLDYFGARYYGNWLGRFLSADWAEKPEAVPYSDLHDPQSLNLYSYVRNIPTVGVDADGHVVQYAGGYDPPSGHRIIDCTVEQTRCEIIRRQLTLDAENAQSVMKGINKEMGNAARGLHNLFCRLDPNCSSEDIQKDKKANNSGENIGMWIAAVATFLGGGEEESAVRATELYARFSKSGEFLKWGISENAATRYTAKELEGGFIDVVARGSRKEMLRLERWLTERAPGPLNREPWAGANYSNKALRAVEKFLDRILSRTN